MLLDEWISETRPRERDEALTELARRYFTGHGPATVHDFVWWSGLTVAEAKLGIELAADLSYETLDGTLYWFADGSRAEAEPLEAQAHLLPFFDEFLVAYRDRSAALEPAYVKHLNAGGGLLNPTARGPSGRHLEADPWQKRGAPQAGPFRTAKRRPNARRPGGRGALRRVSRLETRVQN